LFLNIFFQKRHDHTIISNFTIIKLMESAKFRQADVSTVTPMVAAGASPSRVEIPVMSSPRPGAGSLRRYSRSELVNETDPPVTAWSQSLLQSEPADRHWRDVRQFVLFSASNPGDALALYAGGDPVTEAGPTIAG
jgi:hypothetical protein